MMMMMIIRRVKRISKAFPIEVNISWPIALLGFVNCHVWIAFLFFSSPLPYFYWNDDTLQFASYTRIKSRVVTTLLRVST